MYVPQKEHVVRYYEGEGLVAVKRNKTATNTKAHVVVKKRTSLGVKGRGQRRLRGPACVGPPQPMTNYSAQYLVKYVVLLAAGRAV